MDYRKLQILLDMVAVSKAEVWNTVESAPPGFHLQSPTEDRQHFCGDDMYTLITNTEKYELDVEISRLVVAIH